MTPPEDPQPFGPIAKAWVEKTHRAWQAAAARDPDRFLHVATSAPSQAGLVQLRWLAVLGGRERYATWRFGNVTGHVVDRAEVVEKWLEKGKRRPLLIEGRESGVGKSSLAAAAAYAWWHGGTRRVTWAPVAELITPDGATNEDLRRAGPLTLVVLDDLTTAAASWSSFTATVERLHASEARIITTTNLTPSQWDDPAAVDPRVRRRLRDDAERVPMPDVRLHDDPPPGPSLDPCPYGCAAGWLIAEDHPDAYEVTEAYAEAHHVARLPDPEGEDLERLAELRADAERAFDHLGRNLAVPCPHCSAA